MQLGVYLRNYGPASTPATMAACARRAEAAGIDHIWVADHVAIPPDNAEGSGGRYVDPLATLAFLAATTERIGLGTGVLVLPYRGALETAKWVASVQELSAGRLLFGIGVGSMREEFRVLDLPFERRGAMADAVLAFVDRCFAADEVVQNGQPFLFLPRPARPPIFVGGAGPHAIRRVVRHGAGWIAPRSEPEALRGEIAALQEAMAAAGRAPAQVMPLTALPLDDPPAAAARARALVEVGVSGLIHYGRYADESGFARQLETLVDHVRPALAA